MRYFLICFFLLTVTAVRSQSFEKIHTGAILVDTHNDFLMKALDDHIVFDTDLRGIAQSDLERMKAGGVKLQVFSVFLDEHYGKGSAFKFANLELDSLYAIVARNPKTMMIAYSYQDVLRAVRQKKLACMSGVEGGHMIEDDLSNIDSFYRRGVRYMTLTWNNSTSWATSAADESQQSFKVTPYGLTETGKQVVKRMNDLGMIVDISHVGEKTFWDVLNTTSRPVIASHSSVYALCPVPRNLKDDQIRAVAKNGGVVQINFYSAFIDSGYLKKLDYFLQQHKKENDSLNALNLTSHAIIDYFSKRYKSEFENMRPPLSMLIDHIEYVIRLVGVDYVGLGSDFDGIESAPAGLDGVDDYPKITQALVKKGYGEKDIRKILGGNFLRVLKANENKK